MEDHTSGHHTDLRIKNGNHVSGKFRLQGDPRRRVIPRDNFTTITIRFGRQASFVFTWLVSVDPSSPNYNGITALLSHAARESQDLKRGEGLTVLRDPNLNPTAFEERTHLTPDVPTEFDGQPLRQVHGYKTLGEGAFGVVSKAVDLATGSIYAVKTCRQPPHHQR